MIDLLITASLSTLVLALFVYCMGFTIMMWRPFFVAFTQDKFVTELYGFTGIFREWGKALIWPWLLVKKSG